MPTKQRGTERRGEEREPSSESRSLKEREYRDAQGNIHHHTRKYMEEHQGEKKK